MLSRDQVSVARLLDPLPESREFAFAGGAALIAPGLVQRSTVDLDYFASRPQEVARLDVRPERGDPLGLDLAYDYRMRPTVEAELGRTLDPGLL